MRTENHSLQEFVVSVGDPDSPGTITVQARNIYAAALEAERVMDEQEASTQEGAPSPETLGGEAEDGG